MPLKLVDSDNEAVKTKNVEDSDEEIFSIKRNKTGVIKSDDESDEGEIVKGYIDKLNKTSDNEIRNFDESSSKPLGNGNLELNHCALSSTETELQLDHAPSSGSYETNSLFNGQRKNFKQLFSNRDLYDPEDSDDDNHVRNAIIEDKEKSSNYDAEGSSDENEKQKSVERKSKPQKARKSAKHIEKKDEVAEIHSETQRLIRHSRVSLPYHKPRQRTLAEFLQRRPSIPTKSIRMSSDELKLLAKQVAKRAKEAEEFYKSSSDEELTKKNDTMKGVQNDEQLSNTSPLVSDIGDGDVTEKEGLSKIRSDTSNKISDSADENIKRDNAPRTGETPELSDNCCNIAMPTSSPAKVNTFAEKANSNYLNLKNNVSEKIDEGKRPNCQSTGTNVMIKYSRQDSQSGVKLGNSERGFEACDSTNFTTDVLVPYDEIDSQDLHLRIDNSETFDAVNEKKEELTTLEQSLTNAVKNVTSFEKSGEELGSKNPLLSDSFEEMSSQQLCLRIEDSESFETVNKEQKENSPAGEFFVSESVPNIMTTKDYEKCVLQRHEMSESDPVNKEIHVQDPFRIQNSGILDIVDIKSKEVKNRNTFSNVLECAPRNNEDEKLTENNKSIFNGTNIPITTSEKSESKSMDLHLGDIVSFDLPNDTEGNKMETATKGVYSSRKNLSKFFFESVNQVEDNCISNSKGSKEISNVERGDNLKLILEDEETMLSFDYNGSTMLDKELSEQCRSERTDKLHTEDCEVSSELCIESTEENSKIWEKKKELAKKSYDSLTHMKNFPFESEENILNAVRKLSGSNNDNTKNSKLLRTMTLLEDRLKSTRKSLKLQKAVPQLKGSPSKVIDLDDTPSSCDINILKQRFLRHSFPKIAAPPKPVVEISIVSAEKGLSGEFEVKKEIVTVEPETENLVGSRDRLLKFKQELQRQIVKEREEVWNKRQLEMKEANSFQDLDEKSVCGMFEDEEEEDDILESDDANSEDEDSEEDEEEEEEEDEDDAGCGKTRKSESRKRTCAYVDDEAEVSDEDMCDESGISDDEDNNLISDNTEDTALGKDPPGENPGGKVCETKAPVTSLQRMKTLDPFESQEVSSNSTDGTKPPLTSARKMKKSADQSQSLDTEGDIEVESSLSIPPYQPGGAVSQISEPIRGDSFVNILPPTLPTPLRKRQAETENIFSQFPQSLASFGELGLQNSLNENDADDAELLGLCSGKFSSQPPEISQDENGNSDSELTSTLCLQKKFVSLESNDVDQIKSSTEAAFQSNKLLQSKGETFLEISEVDPLIKEKEGTHERNTSSTQKRKYIVVSSSDDDEAEEDLKNNLPRKLFKKLQFSDDEDENEEETTSIKSADNGDSDDAESDPEELQEVDYDSEENEVVFKPSAAKEFFENEAELSESEWGSADEDEKGLDDFEVEEADSEKLNQSKLRAQLEKIHMRQVLDEDQQEIKRLQELLLEDGEFHSEGGGRQRQFRWKNLNDADDLQFSKKSDDDILVDGDEEEEDESEWRRMRFEREVFLQEHKESLEKDEELLNAVKLKFKSPLVLPKKPGQVKRGSFLTRSESALARIAQLTKNSIDVNVSGPTNSRNFVFIAVSQDTKVDDNQGVKRKALKVEAPVAKKMCVGESLLDQLE